MTRRTAPHDVRASSPTEPLLLACRDISKGIAEAIDLARLEGRRTTITRRGRPVAAVVSLDDLARLEQRAAAAPEGNPL